MKWYYLILLPFMSLSFLKCFFASNKIVYEFEQGSKVFGDCTFEHEFNSNPDTVVKTFLSLSVPPEINPAQKAPLTIEYRFSEATPHAEKLKSVDIKLYNAGNNSDLTGTKLKNSEFTIVFPGEGGKINKSVYVDSGKFLNSLIDWRLVNYEYEFAGVKYTKEKNYIDFEGDNTFELSEYPEKLRVVVTLVWENEEKRIEALLLKKKYEKPKKRLDLKY